MPFWAAIPAAISAASSIYSAIKGNDSNKYLKRIALAGYDDPLIQGYLPESLRNQNINPALKAGFQGITQLIQNPGGLSPTVLDAIRPQLAQESENIAQNYRGIRAEQQGTAARTNAPVSIKNALSSALDVAQERAQRQSRRGALMASDQLRRQDLDQTYRILDTILQFISSAKGQAIPGLGQYTQNQTQQNAATTAALGSLTSALASLGKSNVSGGGVSGAGGVTSLPGNSMADYQNLP